MGSQRIRHDWPSNTHMHTHAHTHAHTHTHAYNPKGWLYLEGWEGERGGREVPEGGNICIPMADPCWYLAETNTIL